MPAVVVKKKSFRSSSSSSSANTQQRLAISDTLPAKETPVVIVVEGDAISVYTEQEALDQLAKG